VPQRLLQRRRCPPRRRHPHGAQIRLRALRACCSALLAS
jgi:hypothetical protein